MEEPTINGAGAPGRDPHPQGATIAPIRPDIDLTDKRPLIRLGADLKPNVDAAVAGLALDPDLYQRDAALVRVTHAAGDEAPVIRPHTLATLRVRLAEFCRFQRFEKKKDGGGDWVNALPPDTVTKAVLEQASWPTARTLVGVVESPFARPDLTIVDGPARFDEATGFLYQPTGDFPKVREHVTQERAAAALRFAWVGLCYDFPFRGMGYADDPNGADADGLLRFAEAVKHPDAWGVIAAIMTLIARPAITGSIPAIVFDASTPGSGKGLQADLVSIVASGRMPGKLTWPNRGTETNAEVEKMLQGEARSGATITVLDEITGAFGGPAINNVLTGEGWAKFRILGLGETHKLRWSSVLLGTGNNISFADNTHRRILLPRLEPPEERPEEHKGFRHADLKGWARENRPRLVAALLTVLRGYACAGRPETDLPIMGGFESWSALIPRAIRWAGGGDVLGCRPTVDPEARNEEMDAMALIMASLARLQPSDGTGLTMGAYLNLLYPADRLRGEYDRSIPDPHDDAREAIESITRAKSGRKPDAKPLGDRLKVWKKRPIGAMQFERVVVDRNGSAKWTVAPVKK